MPFSAEEIESKSFLITLRGYDREEVDAFLRAVAADLRAAAAISDARDVGALSENVDAFTNAGLAVAEVLHSAVEVADGMRHRAEESIAAKLDIAEAQIDAIKTKAYRTADRIVANAQHVLDDAQERAELMIAQARANAEYILDSAQQAAGVR